MAEHESLLRENIKKLTPYSTARDEYDGPLGIYLDANENPFESGYNRYPDPHQRALKRQLAAIKGTEPDNIFIGNGSDEAIDILYRIFCEPGRDNAVSIAPTYGMYRVAAAINDVQLREVALGENFAFSARELLAAADGNTRLAFLCSPNNPTGNLLDEAEVEKFITSFEGITVLDEAY
ncbi:MAG: aminotransferase class I/II-fold pyridoxal phosphate-dependent enzyme, partial [Rikenellaceae bacterium]|nr:aminotransferase class I/II-fold pyridoxal phosphate-dependent enzyme [Rikenellaceae bacterium]